MERAGDAGVGIGGEGRHAQLRQASMGCLDEALELTAHRQAVTDLLT
ncbi:hypothetical protein GCM10023195_65080 [Actinoallomurus liliacearum]|uniref:Uncharacterized protein n=1 Tax=Actinoallomurus liliacearum TaxID=1080073 RepID=A0ABP8TS21_9ACTN